MKKPQSIPVEQARKEFADILDGSQHKGEHAEITRRGKRSGVLVPPDWYDAAVAALAEVKELRRQLTDAQEAQHG
ncbi:type II toxin-antitoxin system Phd/YefM family antitoxin [Streptomyces sp. NPDC102405]|uniref:type II toxin-antitoxin system Phd/YefM family antitoxin n=1 Tax=Streptomyces sp. NPDC102405 TaxID=3366170 RepID=UPI0037F48004